jgi:AcrR family transcriptional regulator
MSTAKRDTYTPETLLSVAVQVFIERGYDGTSMEHLSKAAGISKSSIYHHVTGKEELLRRAVSRALDELFGILDEEHARVGTAAERLEYVVRRMVEVLMAELPYVTLLLRVRGNTGTERWALERRREFDHRVADLLKAAAAEGDVRADVEVRLATRLVFGMINSIVEWYRPAGPDGRGGAGEREVVDAVARLVFGGLRKVSCAGSAASTGLPARRSALRFEVLGLEHQQGARAEDLGDGLEAGEHQFAQRPVVRRVHQQQDVEVAAHQGDVRGAGKLP